MLLEMDSGGREGDGRLLVLLHGMGTTREVWAPLVDVVEREWNGRWIAPDLRGHGRSPRAQSYALGQHACDVAETVAQAALRPSMIVVLGHSMGGMVALALASGGFGIQPSNALGVGIKMIWTREEITKLLERARMPAKEFDTVDAAIGMYLKISGLSSLVSSDHKMARAGIAGKRLAADPLTGQIGPPDMPALVAAARCPIHLAAGDADPMVTLGDMRAHDRDAQQFAGVGHNAMIEAPEQIFAWMNACVRNH